MRESTAKTLVFHASKATSLYRTKKQVNNGTQRMNNGAWQSRDVLVKTKLTSNLSVVP
jgi:hypothetical protein